jgi:hypothetical protein
MPSSRRKVLALAALAPLALLARAPSAAAQGQTCYDPDALPLSQRSRRRSLGYVEQSSDPARHCGACNFFTAANPDCGACAMLGGGPVTAGAVCSSFAPKAR